MKHYKAVMPGAITKIPGIGKKMTEHLSNVGYPDIESLKGQAPEEKNIVCSTGRETSRTNACGENLRLNQAKGPSPMGKP